MSDPGPYVNSNTHYFERLIHYSKRPPVWIKLYTDLLESDEYLDLTGHERAILTGLWQVEAQIACAGLPRRPISRLDLSRRLALRITRTQLEGLSDAGFIHIPASRDAY